MILTLLYVVLAAFGLGFLIFIHEWGHYWAARREGMRVEVFSIGFGKPFYSWERNGVKWQFCSIPFGGFVRIAGMETKGASSLSQIPEGFFSKTPWARIRVTLMGPIVNIVFAFFAFSLLWTLGGRLKPFSEYTHLMGSVDRDSGIYATGVRPGDRITTLNGVPFSGFQDFLYVALLQSKPPILQGEEVDYLRQTHTPFTYPFTYSASPTAAERAQTLLGAIRPAAYLIYNQAVSLSLNQDSPMKESGIVDGDRLLWVDGELIFSRDQLVSTINEPRALLTIKRGSEVFLSRVPRLQIRDLRLTSLQRAELEDWQHEAQLKGKVQDLFFIPYNLTAAAIVENTVAYLNAKSVEQEPSSSSRAPLEIPLQVGDQILAVDGMKVSSSYEMIHMLQSRHLQVIVKRGGESQPVSSKEADRAFLAGIDWQALNRMIHSIGTDGVMRDVGDLHLLLPVEPRPLRDLPLSEAKREEMQQAIEARNKQIEALPDEKQRQQALQMLSREHNQLKLGIVMTDKSVRYNPSPVALFGQVFKETWKTLFALFTGSVTPKYMSGPVGIVQVMQQSWGYGFKEALFWLGMISLNLGILNLLPIPVLDGGHVCFALWEKVTGRPIQPKTMERLIIPFVILLVALLLYLTYNDVMRIFSRFI